MLSLHIGEVVLVQFNLVNNQDQQKYKVFYTFTHNKSHPYLLNADLSNLVFFEKL